MPYVAELVKLKNGSSNIGTIVREKVAHVLTGDATKVGFTRGATELAQQQSQPFLEWFCTIAVPWLLRPANSIRSKVPQWLPGGLCRNSSQNQGNRLFCKVDVQVVLCLFGSDELH